MEKYITDERTGLRYELIGDIYYLAGDDHPEEVGLVPLRLVANHGCARFHHQGFDFRGHLVRENKTKLKIDTNTMLFFIIQPIS